MSCSSCLPAKKMIHKAQIEVDRNGAGAKAATRIILNTGLPPEDEKEVILNRPFLFAIYHRSLDLQVPIGVVNQLENV